MKKSLLIICGLGLAFFSQAQWSGNQNLTPGTTGNKTGLTSLPDGSGGVFLVWEDDRNSATTDTDLYALYLKEDGSVATGWPATGLRVTNTTGDQDNANITSDGTGGILIGYVDDSIGNDGVRIQRISASGVLMYGSTGKVITDDPVNLENRATITIVNGTEAMIIWADNRLNGTTSNGVDIFANKIDIATGNKVFPSDIVVVSESGTQTALNIVPDGLGGAFMIWQDPRISTTGADIFADRMLNNGTLLEGSSGKNITPNTAAGSDNQIQPIAIPNGSGGFFVAWSDQRSGNTNGNIYVQNVSATLTELWTAKGVAVCEATGIQSNPVLLADGAGGVIIAWADQRISSSDRNLYAHRINALGIKAWAPTDGVEISTAPGSQPAATTDGLGLVSDGLGGAYISWTDSRPPGSSSLKDIYIQRISALGVVSLVANGLNVINEPAPATQFSPILVASTNNSAIIGWVDSRNLPTSQDVYVSKLLADGTLPVSILQLAANAQGKQVMVNWTSTNEQVLKQFEIERSTDGNQFVFAGTVVAINQPGTHQYSFTDAFAATGVNFYRIKSVDLDGKYSYSNMVKVSLNIDSPDGLYLYPNPSVIQATLQLNDLTPGNYSIRIIGLNGQVNQSFQTTITSSNQRIQLPVQQLRSGNYRIQVIDEKGKQVGQLPLLKQ